MFHGKLRTCRAWATEETSSNAPAYLPMGIQVGCCSDPGMLPMASRDEFAPGVKKLLAARVGYRCSNPNCRILTSGPSAKASINIGVASHITAASPKGPRYDRKLSTKERRSAHNGIWLCQNHGKHVDDDAVRFPVPILRKWKELSEQAALLEIEEMRLGFATGPLADTNAIKLYGKAFDRPVFKDRFDQEMSMTAFDKAIADTILALSTGILQTREGTILERQVGRNQLTNPDWSERIGVVINILESVRNRFRLAEIRGELTVHGGNHGVESYFIRSRELVDWMDSSRSEAVRLMSEIHREAGFGPLEEPVTRRWGR